VERSLPPILQLVLVGLTGTQLIRDDVFARLLTFPNVLLTAHQAFFTEPALRSIAEITLANLDDIVAGRPCPNEL